MALSLLAAGCTAQAHARHVAGPLAVSAPASPPAVRTQVDAGTTAWRIRRLGSTAAIEGYASAVSVLPGRSFRLYVSTTAARFSVSAYRMGWYAGSEGRLVWRSGSRPGRVQPAAALTPLRSVETHWRPSLSVSTRGWPVGDYLLDLRADTGAARYVPLTVRSASTAGDVVLVNSVMTWEAYNAWGGYDLYHGADGAFADRSYAVSFDRPYDGDGASSFLAFELPVVATAERLGLPLAYETSVDVATHPGLLDGAAAVVSLGHDEYWTPSERAAVLAARAGGTNDAFLGANAEYWRVRLASGGRLVVCYKDAGLDPVHGISTTARFRDSPDPHPESTLTGLQYECYPASGSYTIYRPGFWLFAGTGARVGERLPGLVGIEIDRAYPLASTPRPIEVVAHSPASCGGVRTYSDSAYLSTPSGAAVFDTGTMRWVCALGGGCERDGVTAASVAFVRRVTENLLSGFAYPRAGAAHPAAPSP